VSVGDGDGRMILLLAAIGIFLALRYRERLVGLMPLGEAVLGALVALTAIARFDWDERGLGLGLLLLAGPVWLAAAALPDRGVRWIEEVLTGEAADNDLIGASSSKACPGCDRRLRFAARSCGFCGFSLTSGRATARYR
jgi:prepilin signal peptidase PulO-like enzyme (type II secretory pathway)